MRWLLFLSRLAFICGICFLLSLSLRIWNWSGDEAISSTIIIIGFVIGLTGRSSNADLLPRSAGKEKSNTGASLAGNFQYYFPVHINALYNFYQC